MKAKKFTDILVEYQLTHDKASVSDIKVLRAFVGNFTIDQKHIANPFLRFCEAKGYAPGNIKKLWNTLMRIVNWGKIQGLVDPEVEYHRPNFPRVPKHTRVLRSSEYGNLVTDLRYRFPIDNAGAAWLLAVLYGTGARASEGVSLRYSDVTEDTVRLFRTKTGNETVLPVPSIMREHPSWDMIAASKKETPILEGFPKALPAARAILNRLFNPPGTERLERVTPHTLRHSFATRLLAHGYDLALVSYLMGHTSLEQTQYYAKIVGNDLLEKRALTIKL